MPIEDMQAGSFVSAIVLIAAVVFTANVYMIYSADKDVAVYQEAENTYNQAASVFVSLRDVPEPVVATTTDEAVGDTVN